MKDYRFFYQTNRFLEQLQASGYAETTRAEFTRLLGYFREYLRDRGRKNDVRAVDKQLIAEYRRHVLSIKKYSDDYKIGMLIDVRNLFRWVVAEGLILSDPTATMILPKMSGKKLPPYLNQEDAPKLIEAAEADSPRGLIARSLKRSIQPECVRQS